MERVAAKFDVLMKGDPRQHVHDICGKYIISRSKDVLRDAIIALTPLQQSIYRYQAELLTLGGLGKEWIRSEEVSKVILKVVRYLEDLLCYAMVDPEELIDLFRRHQLGYQLNS